MKRNTSSSTIKAVGATTRTRRIVVIVRPPVDALDVIGPAEAFGIANRLWPEMQPPYQVELVTSGSERFVSSEIGIGLHAHATLDEVKEKPGRIDTLLIASGLDNRNEVQPRLIDWIHKQAETTRRICSICVGAFTLAQTGLLDGKRVTTHWALADELARLHPRITVDPRPIWIQDGHIYTSAGISSGIDLALALIAEDLGSEYAMRVAKSLVLFMRRPGGQAQFSESLKLQSTRAPSLQRLQLWIAEHLNQELNLEVLADKAAISRRTLIRLFKKELNTTPAKYIEGMRLEAAKQDIELGNGDMQGIARHRGFHSVDVMRRTFIRHTGVTPTQYAERFSLDQVE
jgi:transcriptional regulator GlxA family with amidase domain